MRRSILLGAVAALTLVAAPLQAQGPHSSPEALALEAHRLVALRDWNALAGLVERPALDRAKTTFTRVLELDPDPQVLALFGVTDLDSFRELAPHDVMTAIYRASAANLETMELISTDVLGVVYEGDDQAHVVLRQIASIHGVTASSAELSSMRRYEDGWWFQLNTDLEGMLLGIESQLDGGEQ